MEAIEILTDVYIQKHADDEEFDTTFDVSNGYIYYFKIWHNFVSKLSHLNFENFIKLLNNCFII